MSKRSLSKDCLVPLGQQTMRSYEPEVRTPFAHLALAYKPEFYRILQYLPITILIQENTGTATYNTLILRLMIESVVHVGYTPLMISRLRTVVLL